MATKVRAARAFRWLVALSASAASLAAAAPAPPSVSGVTIVQGAAAMVAFTPQSAIIRDMVRRGVLAFTGRADPASAWRSVVATNEVAGIKVVSAPGRISGTRPEVVAAVIEGLLAAGLPPGNIVVWDRQLADLRLAGFFELAGHYGVRVAAAATAGWDEATYYENSLIGRPVWGDQEFGRTGDTVGRRSYCSRLVSREITRHISIAPLRNHNLAGIHGHLYSLAMGSVDNSIRFESGPKLISESVPEIFALPVIFDKLALCITDALVCQYQGDQRSLLHYSATLSQMYFGRDAVALDTLGLGELEAQRGKAGVAAVKFPPDLYRNATLLELGMSDLGRIRISWAP